MMKKPNQIRRLLLSSAASLIVFPGLAWAEQDAPKVETKREVKVMRIGGDPDVEKDVRVIVRHGEHHDMAMEPTTFLGVETMRVSSTLTEQLGLDRGIGLVVQRVVGDSAATEVLKKHDILTKLDDQLLVSSDQLGVLVRSKEPGSEVTLTFIRGGKVQTAKVALKARKQHANVFHLDDDHHGMEVHEFHSAATVGDVSEHIAKLRGKLSGKIDRADVDQLLSKLGNKSEEGFAWVSADEGPVVRMLNINSGNVMFSDDEGAIELKTEGGEKRLVVKSTKGEVIFDGPVNTDEERQALDNAIRLRLEKVEGIETLEFHTDEDFETEDVRVIAPKGGSVRVIRRGENHPLAVPSQGA